MKRDGDHLWRIVAATVRPFPGRSLPPLAGEKDGAAVEKGARAKHAAKLEQSLLPLADASRFPRKRGLRSPVELRAPDPIEPNRFHRLTRGRAPDAPKVDLHNLNQDRARAVLTAFVLRAHAEGERTVLVITGKGALGDGILRRRTPEWLAEAPLRAVVAGLSEAHRRHGGEGALYVALKRRESLR